jgi:hypothetical protein
MKFNEPTLRESAEEKDIEIYDKLLKDGVVKKEQDTPFINLLTDTLCVR